MEKYKNTGRKGFFKPIHEHRLYSDIYQRLIQIKEGKTIDEIISILWFFKKITQNDDKSFNYYYQSFKRSFQGQFSISSMIQQLLSLFFRNQNIQIKKILDEKEKYQELKRAYSKYYIQKLFQKVAEVILNTEKSQSEYIPIMYSYQEYEQTLSQKQIIYLMCLMTMNLVPQQQYHLDPNLKKNFNYRSNTFSFIFNNNEYKTRNILEYLKFKLLKQPPQPKDFYQTPQPQIKFTIKRSCVMENVQNLLYQNKNNLSPFYLQKNDSSIQEYYGEGKVDFANKYIGGGALRNGCVQQEIMYANHPQLYVTMILCESLKDNEALLYKNFKKYFEQKNYGYRTQYGYMERKISEKEQYIVAIDAIDFSKNQHWQFSQKAIDREIIKAYSGFKNTENTQYIVTGNWGCGVFKGDLKLKFLIQWIAASLVGKKLIYCPYGDYSQLYKVLSDLQKILSNSKNKITIRQIYESLIDLCKQYHRYDFDILKNICNHLERKTVPMTQKPSSRSTKSAIFITEQGDNQRQQTQKPSCLAIKSKVNKQLNQHEIIKKKNEPQSDPITQQNLIDDLQTQHYPQFDDKVSQNRMEEEKDDKNPSNYQIILNQTNNSSMEQDQQMIQQKQEIDETILEKKNKQIVSQRLGIQQKKDSSAQTDLISITAHGRQQIENVTVYEQFYHQYCPSDSNKMEGQYPIQKCSNQQNKIQQRISYIG